jgi:hypothetical protein
VQQRIEHGRPDHRGLDAAAPENGAVQSPPEEEFLQQADEQTADQRGEGLLQQEPDEAILRHIRHTHAEGEQRPDQPEQNGDAQEPTQRDIQQEAPPRPGSHAPQTVQVFGVGRISEAHPPSGST